MLLILLKPVELGKVQWLDAGYQAILKVCLLFKVSLFGISCNLKK